MGFVLILLFLSCVVIVFFKLWGINFGILSFFCLWFIVFESEWWLIGCLLVLLLMYVVLGNIYFEFK